MKMKYKDAGLGERIIAQIIDGAIFYALYGIFMTALILPMIQMKTELPFLIAVLLMIPAYMLYTFLNEVILVGWKGYTIGKKLTKLRIVKADGGNIGYGPAIVRALIKNVIFILGIIGAIIYLVTILAGKDQKSVADHAGGCKVIKLR
jgi:uncharacterized RDD family membrane protein YckC